MKEEIKNYFKGIKYEKGDVRMRGEIISAYNALWGENPGVQYMREAEGSPDKYTEILLECLQKGEPYKMSKADEDELARLDAEGILHDGF